jgi:aryl-alcohol dehydrogenase-like predicted oxidoreductase
VFPARGGNLNTNLAATLHLGPGAVLAEMVSGRSGRQRPYRCEDDVVRYNEVPDMTHANPSTVMIGETAGSRIGLGTNRLTHTPENIAFVREAIAAGLTHIDTAYLYTGGESEQTIGEALPSPTDGVIVATKGGFRAGEGAPEVLRSQIETSLERLKTERIALYYLHRIDPQTPFEHSLAALKEFRDSGKIRNVGLSEVGIEQIEQARELVPIAAVQNHYNLTERRYEDVVDYCAREGIIFVPFYPLGGQGGSQLDEIADRHNATPAQIAIAWLLRRSPTMLPIPGTLSLDHLEQNLSALEIELSDAEFEALR